MPYSPEQGSGVQLSMRKDALSRVKDRKVTEEAEQEKELVKRAKRGDRDAYQQLVIRHQNRAFRIAYGIVRSKEDAEDVIQESFVKAYISLGKFRGQSAFYTWLYRIVYNMAIDLKRKRGRRGGEPAEFDESLLNTNASAASVIGKVESPQGALNRKEQGRRIQEAMEGLSEEHATVVTLREFDGLSYDEIARITGVSKGTVMSRLHYARKKLQEALRDIAPYVQEESDHQQGSEQEGAGSADEEGATSFVKARVK